MSDKADTDGERSDQTTSSLPKMITFPYSRHSSYTELRHLVSAFRPRDIHPCTAPTTEEFKESQSMASLFGDLIAEHDSTNPPELVWDMAMRKKVIATKKMKRSFGSLDNTQEMEEEVADAIMVQNAEDELMASSSETEVAKGIRSGVMRDRVPKQSSKSEGGSDTAEAPDRKRPKIGNSLQTTRNPLKSGVRPKEGRPNVNRPLNGARSTESGGIDQTGMRAGVENSGDISRRSPTINRPDVQQPRIDVQKPPSSTSTSFKTAASGSQCDSPRKVQPTSPCSPSRYKIAPGRDKPNNRVPSSPSNLTSAIHPTPRASKTESKNDATRAPDRTPHEHLSPSGRRRFLADKHKPNQLDAEPEHKSSGKLIESRAETEAKSKADREPKIPGNNATRSTSSTAATLSLAQSRLAHREAAARAVQTGRWGEEITLECLRPDFKYPYPPAHIDNADPALAKEVGEVRNGQEDGIEKKGARQDLLDKGHGRSEKKVTREGKDRTEKQAVKERRKNEGEYRQEKEENVKDAGGRSGKNIKAVNGDHNGRDAIEKNTSVKQAPEKTERKKPADPAKEIVVIDDDDDDDDAANIRTDDVGCAPTSSWELLERDGEGESQEL